MSKFTSSDFSGRKSTAREPIAVLEPKREDKSMDKLLKVRGNRVSRYERELSLARTEWRDARARLREAKVKWREAVAAAQERWQQARSQFFSMNTTSGQFRQAKAVYDRMKAAASQCRLDAKEVAQSCRKLGVAYFEAMQRLTDIQRQQEKLTVIRDELRALNNQSGD